MVPVCRMRKTDIDRIREVDRTQHVMQAYVLKNGALELTEREPGRGRHRAPPSARDRWDQNFTCICA